MLKEIMQKTSFIERKIIDGIKQGEEYLFSVIKPDKYIGLIDAYPQTMPYTRVGADVQRLYDKIIHQKGPGLTERFHQVILIRMIAKNAPTLENNFPKCIADQFLINYNRILKHIEKMSIPKGFYLYSSDGFLKDFCVCSLRMIPAGNHKLEISGFSRQIIFRNGLRQFADSLMFLLKIKGNIPFYQLHMDIHDRNALKECNPKGTIKLFLRISKLLEVKQEIKGVFGSSWMNDPQLETISPVIFSGPKIVRQNGGKLYYNGSTPETVKGATVASSRRKKLFELGKYTPSNYMLIWHRDDLINWAKSQPAQEL